MNTDFDELLSPPSPTEPTVADRVRMLLAKHANVPRHQQVGYLADLLQIERSVVYRRMSNRPAWSNDELRAIAARLSVPAEVLLTPPRVAPVRTEQPSRGSARALPMSSPVQGTVGETITQRRYIPSARLSVSLPQRNVGFEVATGRDAERALYVAVEGAGGWEIMQKHDVPPGKRSHAVRSIIFDVLEPHCVAILEDDTDIAENLRLSLEASGLKATHFASIDELSAELSRSRFRAYVIDWYIGRKTAADIVARIRAMQPDATIALCTGKVDEYGEASLMDFANSHKALLVYKPYRMSWLINALRMGITHEAAAS